MNARERLERIERELLQVRKWLLLVPNADTAFICRHLDQARDEVTDAIELYPRELEKVEVPGE